MSPLQIQICCSLYNFFYAWPIILNFERQPFYFPKSSSAFKPITVSSFLTNYRLCILASGFLITDIFNFCMLISVSCLHFEQNSGKFSSIVSSRILSRVLLLQTGHNIQPISVILSLSCSNAIIHTF